MHIAVHNLAFTGSFPTNLPPKSFITNLTSPLTPQVARNQFENEMRRHGISLSDFYQSQIISYYRKAIFYSIQILKNVFSRSCDVHEPFIFYTDKIQWNWQQLHLTSLRVSENTNRHCREKILVIFLLKLNIYLLLYGLKKIIPWVFETFIRTFWRYMVFTRYYNQNQIKVRGADTPLFENSIPGKMCGDSWRSRLASWCIEYYTIAQFWV